MNVPAYLEQTQEQMIKETHCSLCLPGSKLSVSAWELSLNTPGLLSDFQVWSVTALCGVRFHSQPTQKQMKRSASGPLHSLIHTMFREKLGYIIKAELMIADKCTSVHLSSMSVHEMFSLLQIVNYLI